MKKLYYSAAIGLAALSLMAGAVAVGAQSLSDKNDYDKENSDSSNSTHMSVTINPNGRGRIAGTVASVSASTLNLNSWGGVWVVDISKAKIFRRFGGASSASEIQSGDYVTVAGTVSASGWAVTAVEVRDSSIQTRNVNPKGVVSSATSAGFTLTAGSKNYAITLNANTTVTVNGRKAAASNITNGARAQVWGLLDRTESTIIASRVNISIPRVYRSGTVSNVTATGFTLNASEGKTYTVAVDSNTSLKINGKSDSLSNVPAGAKVQVSGLANSDSAITASAVNVYIPRPKQNDDQNKGQER